MAPWAVNALALFATVLLVSAVALGLLWRIGLWRVPRVASLTFDEGLPIGSEAPDIAAHDRDRDVHLSFQGWRSLVVFGTRACKPCHQLLEAAIHHPATRHLRLVYISDADDVDVNPDALRRWETYRFHDEMNTRRSWHAPVSPYFHVVNQAGHVIEKGIANTSEHLDRLLQLSPALGRAPRVALRYGTESSPEGGLDGRRDRHPYAGRK